MKNRKPVLIVGSAVLIVGILASIVNFNRATNPKADGSNTKQPTVAKKSEAVSSILVDQNTTESPAEIREQAVPFTLTQALDTIDNEPDYKERPGMLYDLMLEASLREVQELLKLSNDSNYSEGFRDDMKAAAFERWYHLEPAAALQAMDESMLSASQKNSRVEVFLEEWASRSPQEVVAILEQGQLTGVSADLMYGALVRGSAKNGDLEVVDVALASIEDPKLRYYALKSAARVVQRDHADQFEGWLNTLPAEEQNTAIAESIWMLADKDIDQSLAGLEQLAARGADALPVTRLRVAVKWAENDPIRAANWVVAQNVTGEDREILFANVMRVWVSKDQSAAVNWADSLIEKGEIDEAFMNRVIARF